MMPLVARLGKGAIYEILEQQFGGLVLQHEQNQALITQLQQEVEALRGTVERLSGSSKPGQDEPQTSKKV